MGQTVSYKEAKDLTRGDEVATPSGNRKVAGKSGDGTHVLVTYVGGQVAKLLRNQTMKIVGATRGPVVTPGYLKNVA